MKIAICNKCNALMEDNNPSDESFDFTEENKPIGNYVEMTRNLDSKDDVFHCCPVCMTDEFLQDILYKENIWN